ncbi:hypothetical protein LZ686_17710 [Paracoccus sp. NFXS7]|uniref:hypothetical protein n=1 Tax=Paracoccus sp. NFXS7 TaxID=2908653 RepID=UPI0032E01E3D
MTPITVGETHVRYFHPQDRAAAEDMAAALDIDARDFVSFTPSPEEGYLELWLGGPGAPPITNPVITRGQMTEPYQALTASGDDGGPEPITEDLDRDSGERGDNPWLRPLNLPGIFGRNKGPEDAATTRSGGLSASTGDNGSGGNGSDGASSGSSPGGSGSSGNGGGNGNGGGRD